MSSERFDAATAADGLMLVQFFATWCEPCVEEFPALDRLSRRFPGRPFTVVAINIGEPETRIRRFLDRVPVGFPVLLDPDKATMKAWGVVGLPATFVLAPGFRPQHRVEGAIDWESPAVVATIASALDAAAAQPRSVNPPEPINQKGRLP